MNDCIITAFATSAAKNSVTLAVKTTVIEDSINITTVTHQHVSSAAGAKAEFGYICLNHDT